MKCPVCNRSSVEQWVDGRPYREAWKAEANSRVFSCTTCSHGFVYPLPPDEVLQRCYSSAYPPYSKDNAVDTSLQEAIVSAKASGRYRGIEVTPGLRILDVGCGGGSFLSVCKAMGAQVQGVEPSEHGVATCLKNDIPVFHGFLHDYLAQSDETFDVVTACHVMEHHPDPVAMISQLKQTLRASGLIWVAVPNWGAFTSQTLKDKWHSSDLPVHLQHFTPSSIATAFENGGFGAISLSTRSENSLGSSLADILKQKFKIPARLTYPILNKLFAKHTPFCKFIDNRLHGEAILIQSHAK